ncbi:hypothetical protein CYY_005838 [Polysphondylium violaceum]|uniref:Cytochrome b5 heme-binding domain-containing protein n=1 Tax=Polysphondylium violaceum TaxID=133409 RepID=A0A8J4PT77_9MYCE|nr:hypothetical protein CYY_005838 [Polysphondylium violaceum]
MDAKTHQKLVELYKSVELLPTDQEVEDKKNGKRKRKVPLQHGHSQLDWVKKHNAIQSNTLYQGHGKIPLSEFKKHNTVQDAWTVYKGAVYNITEYFTYHPGGDTELARAAGHDCTKIFEFTHSWVNFESMMAKNLIGYLIPDDMI